MTDAARYGDDPWRPPAGPFDPLRDDAVGHKPPTEAEPVPPTERIAVVDVLRGFALLGILLVNIQFYLTPSSKMFSNIPFWKEPIHVWAEFLISLFVEMKFYTLFSFLFGFGIATQMLRAEARGRPFLGLHYRRMLVLLGFGLFHAFLIWMGDILVTYALIGCLLPLFFRLRPQTLLVIAGVILVVMFLIFGGVALLLGVVSLLPGAGDAGVLPGGAEGMQEIVRQAEEMTRIYREGTFWEITTLRATEVLSVYMVVLFFQGPHILAMFLLGLYAGRTGWFHRLPETLPWFRKAWWFGLIFGLGGTLVTAYLSSQADAGTWAGLGWKLASVGWNVLAAPALSGFYAASLVLLYYGDRCRAWLEWLAPAGRMALTNYLAQSLICTTLFYGSTILGFGFGLYARIGPAYGIALALGIWLLEVAWSHLWFHGLGLKFGPLEWLWRTLTYGRWQPLW